MISYNILVCSEVRLENYRYYVKLYHTFESTTKDGNRQVSQLSVYLIHIAKLYIFSLVKSFGVYLISQVFLSNVHVQVLVDFQNIR